MSLNAHRIADAAPLLPHYRNATLRTNTSDAGRCSSAPIRPGKTTRWLSTCERCGHEVIVQRNNLTNGKSTRCGMHRQHQAQEAQLLRLSRIAPGYWMICDTPCQVSITATRGDVG
jgi:hypothetical protein